MTATAMTTSAPEAAWFTFGRAVLTDHARRLVADGAAAAATDPSATAATAAPTSTGAKKKAVGAKRTAARSAPTSKQATRPAQQVVEPPSDLEFAEARSDLHRALDGDTAFAALAGNARLGPDDAEVFALLAACETSPACRQLLASIRASGAPTSHGGTQLTLGIIGELLGPVHLGPLALAHDAPLCRSTFAHVVADGAWADSTVVVHPGVIWALLGDSSADPDLPTGTIQYDVSESVDDGGIEGPRADLVVVNGLDRMRRRQSGARHSNNDRFICATAPDADVAWSALVREATITGRGIIVEIDQTLSPLARTWIERADHLAWVVSTTSGPQIDEMPNRRWLDIVAPAHDPTPAEWTAAFGTDVARTHHLTFDQLHRVSAAHRAIGSDLDAAVRRLASGRLEQLTRRIEPTHSWDDIVLSDDRLGLLRSVSDRYRHSAKVYDDWGFSATPSRGVVALFSGPSGTGKTLASEIIAGDLGLDLFKLDLSSVVSKYIGETEKNLEQVFDAASAGNLVLFFDEADSLFGKRSEVKDARDRYANIEVSYLLQRLESYDGLVIMATNFEKNVDEAFLRRIHVRVAFDMPGVAERAAIWSTNLPASAPTADIDIDWLAENFELSGGSIRNASIHAAFAAATAGTPITMESAVLGVAREFRKMGRLLKQSDFGEHHELVNE